MKAAHGIAAAALTAVMALPLVAHAQVRTNTGDRATHIEHGQMGGAAGNGAHRSPGVVGVPGTDPGRHPQSTGSPNSQSSAPAANTGISATQGAGQSGAGSQDDTQRLSRATQACQRLSDATQRGRCLEGVGQSAAGATGSRGQSAGTTGGAQGRPTGPTGDPMRENGSSGQVNSPR